MRKEARYLLDRSIDSIVVGIDHFNRLWDRGRTEAVLIFLDRAFELLLKAIIIERGGLISDKADRSLSIGSSECLRKCVSNENYRCLTNEQGITIQNLNLLRDAAQHYIVSISEGQLYVYAQSALSIYLGLLKSEFSIESGAKFPERLSLVSAAIPSDFSLMLDDEFATIKAMLSPGSRKRLDAKSKLRVFATLERSLGGNEIHYSDQGLTQIAKRIGKGEDWRKIFPGVETVRIDPDANSTGIVLKIAKSGEDADPITLVPEGTPGAAVVGVRRVNELGFYSLYFKDLKEKIKGKFPQLNQADIQTMIKHSNMQHDDQMFRRFMMGTQEHKRYTPKALNLLMQLAKTHKKVASA